MEELLDQKGISYAREDIAEKCILVDILSGVITPLDEGDLVISIFALNTVAKLYGVDLVGANLFFEDLLALYSSPTTQDSRLIAHINGNHYVIITAVTQDSVTYIDPGIGKDGENESLTVTKEGFLKVWKGNVTLEQANYNVILSAQPEGSLARLLTKDETKQIRGAFWGSLLNLAAFVIWIFNPAIGSILYYAMNGLRLASLAVSIVEGDWVSAIASVVSIGFSDLGKGLASMFQGAFQGITQALGPIGQILSGIGQVIQGVGHAIYNIYQGVTGFFHELSQGLLGFLHGSEAMSSTIATRIVESAVSVGVNFGVSRGLETLGVSPQIAGFAGSLAAGAVIGGFKGDTLLESGRVITQVQHIQASIQQTVTLSEIGKLGLDLGLDSSFTNIIGLSIGAIQGNIITNPGTTLETAFNNIKPQLFSSLAQYGITRLGTELGIDSRITSLVSLPLSSALEARLAGENIVNSIMEGVLRGGVTLGLEAATKDLSPILGALATRAASGAIAGLISADHNPFRGIFDAYKDSFESLLTLGGSGTSSYQQAVYLSRVLDFSDIIKQRGLSSALETYATSFLYRDSVESIIASAGSIGAHIQKMLQEQKAVPTIANGQDALKIPITEDGSQYIIVSEDQTQILGRKLNGLYEEGTYIVTPDGKILLKTGYETVDSTDGGFAIATKENGQYKSITILSGDKHIILTPSGTKSLEVKQSGNELLVINGTVEDLIAGTKLTYSDGILQTRNTTVGSLRMAFDEINQEYSLNPYESFLEERYSSAGDLLSIRLLDKNPDRENHLNPDTPPPPDVDPNQFGATVPALSLTSAQIDALKQKLGPSFIPQGQSINIAFIPGPNGVAFLAAVPTQGGIAQAQGSFNNNEDPDPQAPGFIDKIKNWVKGVGEYARNYIANFASQDLIKLSAKDRELLRGNPNDLVRVRHNTVPERVQSIVENGKINTSADGKVYLESPDAPNINGVVKQDPDTKATQLGIDPLKAESGIDFYVRRGDLKLADNPVTKGKDLVIEGEIILTNKSPKAFARRSDG